MAIDALEQLKPTLALIPAGEVKPPRRALHEAQAHAQQLAQLISQGALGTNMLRLRLPEDIADQLQLASTALAEAQAVFRARPTAAEEQDAEELWAEAEVAFQDLLATVMFISGGNSGLRRAIRRADSHGRDRSSGFFQLQTSFLAVQPLIRPEDNVDAAALAQECHRWGTRLSKAAAARGGEAREEARDLRNRASTHLENLISAVRQSAAYHFSGDRQAYSAFMVLR